MKKLYIFILTILILCLCSCGTCDTIEPTETIESEPIETAVDRYVETETEPTVPTISYVYHDATEDYLLPIEEYSWEREFDPEFIMIHFSSAIINHPQDPYNIEFIRDTFIQYDVSTHYIIERNGKIRCYIPENRVAWHAGAGEWNNDPKYTNKMNQYAIGIEVVAIGSRDDMSIFMSNEQYDSINNDLIGYTQAQYDAIKLLISDICERNNIPMDREHIIGHEEYSPSKTDPGELFDWQRIVPEK